MAHRTNGSTEQISPSRLEVGDEIRVIAPSKSLDIIAHEIRQNAMHCLEHELGLRISFSHHANESDVFASSSIDARVRDLHDAFSDKHVKAILTVIGGYNCNQLLDHLDYQLIKSNPKILCGYSDITALSCAINKMASLVTFSGPHFSTFGCVQDMDYTIDNFKRCLMAKEPVEILASSTWSDDEWYLDQNNRNILPNDGLIVINHGKAEGRIVGGNLCTLNLLHGTKFMPDLNDTILFIEDDYLVFPEIFDRDLQSLIMQPGFSEVRGIVIGRFQRASKMSFDLLADICRRKTELSDMPIIANADFGHTMPLFTFPVGGHAKIDATKAPSLTLQW